MAPIKHDPGPDLGELAWSPNGKRIAYAQSPSTGGESQVFVMNADGSGVRQLTDDPAWYACRHPSWSPDGKRIALSCTSSVAPCGEPVCGTFPKCPTCEMRLFVVSVDHPPQTLTPITQNYGTRPAFAPN